MPEKGLRIMEQKTESWQPYFWPEPDSLRQDGQTGHHSRPRPPIKPNQSNYLLISVRCEAAPLTFQKQSGEAAARSRVEHSHPAPPTKSRLEWGERARERERETEKLGVTVEQLLLGKHIEPSGRHIHQHTECQSAASAAPPSPHPLHHATVAVVRWGGRKWQGSICKADLHHFPHRKCFYAWFGWLCYNYFPCPITSSTGC